MKKLIYLIALLVMSNCLFAQTKKVYLTSSGKYTANSKKGVAYLLVSKLDDDSAYLATRYDMKNNLLFRGAFKDEGLTMPIGKAVWYKLTPFANTKIDVSAQNNNATYRAMTGYFADGKKAGTWYEYSPKGDLIAKYDYDNDVLNGQYEIFNLADGYHGIGSTINGKLQGDFKVYNTDNLLTRELIYDNGKIKQKTEYLKDAKENADLHAYIERSLRRFIPVTYNSELTMTYVVDKNGNVTNAHIVGGYSPQINQVLLTALTNYNGYKPALYNNVPVDQKVTRTFQIFGSDVNDRHNPIVDRGSIYNDPAYVATPAIAYQGKY